MAAVTAFGGRATPLVVRKVGALLVEVAQVYGLYLVIVVFGTGLAMMLANSVGYSTYSDRPGTGWFGFHPNFSVESLEFLLNFVLFVAVLAVLNWVVPSLIAITVGLRRTSLRWWVVLLVLIPLFGVTTFYLFAEAGWYIAISPVFVDVAVLLSIAFSVVASSARGLSLGRFRVLPSRSR
jgi:uncharacterized membrane protein YhaH (DUF805 family)